ncbi:Cytidylate kinase [Candidatus Desulfarcum epimagneticum]|uniref:Cytidylate kinase n=1 Tax=uncultured Desulfobacteraceae bacterium TaxID=218296 RepID=A0A484HM24_9BACT|nr:Cytidylate kinase [uncultured Desulfobacteraceae bacterium]
MIVTIDGPSGAGKTTVSLGLARRLNYRHIDTGALYRGVAAEALAAGVEAHDDPALSALFETLALRFVRDGSRQRLFSGDKDLTDHIREHEIGMAASRFSASPLVRDRLLEIQRKMGEEKQAVFEGRDMGTVVFPAADVKFFLTASEKIRSLRRFKETPEESGKTLDQIEKDMRLRDHQDSTRAIAPLKPAKDAIWVDSSDMTVHEVIERMAARVMEETKNKK